MSTNNAEKMYTFLRGFASGLNLTNTLNALVFARKRHDGQMRKSGEPYIVHPLAMACNAVSMGIKDDTIIATIILHDVVEDCNCKLDELPVNSDVKDAVNYMTFTKVDGYDKQMQKEIYFKKMIENRAATITKIIDRCHNVSTMAGVFSTEKLKEYIKETRDFVLPLTSDAKNVFPEYSDILFLLKYHIESVIDSIEKIMV